MAGNYLNVTGGNLQKAAKKANDFNKTLGKKKFVAGVTGGQIFLSQMEQ